MGENEERIHREFAEGMGFILPKVFPPWRPNLVFGVWKIADNISISLSMVQPALASSTVAMESVGEIDIAHALNRISVISPSSSNMDGGKSSVRSGRVRVMGRKCMSAVSYMLRENPELGPPSVSFGNMSSTSIVITIGYEGNLFRCALSMESLNLLHHWTKDSIQSTVGTDSLMMYLWDKDPHGNTRLRIDSVGVVGLVGNPSAFKFLGTKLHNLLLYPFSDIGLLAEFLPTLQHLDMPV